MEQSSKQKQKVFLLDLFITSFHLTCAHIRQQQHMGRIHLAASIVWWPAVRKQSEQSMQLIN